MKVEYSIARVSEVRTLDGKAGNVQRLVEHYLPTLFRTRPSSRNSKSARVRDNPLERIWPHKLLRKSPRHRKAYFEIPAIQYATGQYLAHLAPNLKNRQMSCLGQCGLPGGGA